MSHKSLKKMIYLILFAAIICVPTILVSLSNRYIDMDRQQDKNHSDIKTEATAADISEISGKRPQHRNYITSPSSIIPDNSDMPSLELSDPPEDSDYPEANLEKEPEMIISSMGSIASGSSITPNLFEIKEAGIGGVIVTTFEALAQALSQDNGISTVYLGADIIMKEGGFIIHENKSSVVIDGISPEDESRQIHTLTEFPSVSMLDCMRFTGLKSDREATLRNINIEGANYFGTIGVEGTINITLNYENVNYIGPQITYNRYGTARYIDTNITITTITAGVGSPMEEVGEVRYVEFGGNVNIEHNSTTRWVFYLATGEGRIRLHDNANVNVTVKDASVNFLFGYRADFIVGENANFTYTAPGRFNNIALSSLSIMRNGSFRINSLGTVTEPVLLMSGNITVEEEGKFYLNANYNSLLRSAIRLEGNMLVKKGAVFHVIIQNEFESAIRVFGLNRSVVFLDPASVILYNKKNTINFMEGMGTLSIEAQQINYWDRAAGLPQAGSLDDPPKYGWKKADGSNMKISGEVTIGATGNFTNAMTSNYEIGDLPGIKPDRTSFNVGLSRVLSFGRLNLTADLVYDFSTQIIGSTGTNAAVRVSHADSEPIDTQADQNGDFVLPLGTTLPTGTVLFLQSNKDFLTAELELIVKKESEPGVLQLLSVPNELPLETSRLSSKPWIVGRRYLDFGISVSDTRDDGGSWKLYTHVLKPLTPVGFETRPVLEDSLIFIHESGEKEQLSLTDDNLIYKHDGDLGEVLIKWDPDKGLLAEMQPGMVYTDVQYEAAVQWILTDAP